MKDGGLREGDRPDELVLVRISVGPSGAPETSAVECTTSPRIVAEHIADLAVECSCHPRERSGIMVVRMVQYVRQVQREFEDYTK